METVFWQDLNSNNFNVFIRDLSSSMNINLKHMIEDLCKEEKERPKGKKKQKVMKKADIIIQEQNKKRYTQKIDKDNQMIDFFFQNLNDKNPYLHFEKLNTEEGKLEYKFRLLEKYYKQSKYLSHTLNLYFHLKNNDLHDISEKRTKLLTKIGTKLENYNYKSFLFEKLGHLLPPLNYWDKGQLSLDDWQKQAIQYIQHKQSILIRSPTSSGKTFISMATGILHKKVLYVCPAKPVAYQIGANFTKMNYKVHYLLDNHAHLTFSDKTNIFIGIPDMIEKYIYKIGVNFDYVVYDEIHNLTKEYENIIRLFDCNFLALSATIQNSHEYLTEFQQIYPNRKVHYIEYNQRFMNQQRWIWNSDNHKIKKIHPCLCFDPENVNDFHEISFTPNDLVVLYDKLEELFDEKEDIESFSPDNYFKDDHLLTLDDSKEYEKILKEKLIDLSSRYPKDIRLLLDEFKIKSSVSKDQPDFVDFFQKCKQSDLLPMIFFHTNEGIVREMFQLIEQQLRQKELSEFPFHYEILEKKNKIYEEYYQKRKAYEMSIKIKTKDPITEKRDKMNTFDKNEKERYVHQINEFYLKCILKCRDTENEKNKITNLKNELAGFNRSPDFRQQDIFKKHADFCFTNHEPMSGDEIRNIRREILKATGKKINYEDPLFQLLKRGIGIYIKSNPDEYNWIVQRLMSQKKLAIVLSDRTLCLGIDLPIRSSCFTGYKDPQFTKEDYLQMSGRAGRRGHDNRGNIIFHNIENYKELMKGVLPKLEFKKIELPMSYSSLSQLNPKIKMDRLRIKEGFQLADCKKSKATWYLRYYQNTPDFINNLDNYEKKIFMISKNEREYYLFSDLLKHFLETDNPEYLVCYKQNKIKEDFYSDFIQFGNICKDICNSLHPIKYKLIVENCKIIFNKLKYSLS